MNPVGWKNISIMSGENNKMRVKNYILAVLAFAMASFLLIHFGLIAVYGRYYIYESNPLILVSEITLIVAIMAFSSYCIIDQLRKFRVNSTIIKPEPQIYYDLRGHR